MRILFASLTKTRNFLLLAATLIAANVGMLALSPAPVVADECSAGEYKCSGECINGTRVNCFWCSGLCWECGDDCRVYIY